MAKFKFVAVVALVMVAAWAFAQMMDNRASEQAGERAGEQAGEQSAELSPLVAPATQPTTATAPGVPYHAVAVQLYQYATGKTHFFRHIDEIAALGADSVMLVGHGYQEHAGSGVITHDPSIMPTPQQWREVIAYARSRGLRIILMPTVQLSSPRGSEWRGQIRPPDWDDWWQSYTALIDYCTAICVSNNVEVFLIGSELITTEAQPERWRKLISRVRQTYPGKIAYSANWDHHENLPFLDALDYIGMTSYYSLIKPPLGRTPTVEELVTAWKPIREKIGEFHARHGKPILFTEVGYASQEGITSDPWNYYIYRRQNDTTRASQIGLAEQANAFEAFARTFEGEPAVAGVVIWEWNGAGGAADLGYTPRGKPAETVIRSWFTRARNAHHTTQQHLP